MSGGLVAIVLASITGLLAAFLWLSQTQTVNTTADLARAEQRCDRARFDARFDSTLSTTDPAQAASDAERVKRICAEAAQMRAVQRAQAASQAADMQRLRASLAGARRPDPASNPQKEKP